MNNNPAERILASRRKLLEGLSTKNRLEEAAEGGCGVLGFAANIPVAGRHVLSAAQQMHNRGNGKGGGIAMVGLDPVQARVDSQVLSSHNLLQIALLDPAAQREVEEEFIAPKFEVAQAYALESRGDYREVPGLETQPPEVMRYFVRPRQDALAEFAACCQLEELPERALADEFIYQNSFALNRKLYASLGEKRAFVLSQGRDLSVLKIVGYAEDVVSYYCLDDQTAHVWIAHQRYPTKGRVWHPGGAHPFSGLNEALVHNGDFANYHAVSEYLRQRGIGQLFLTDTEVSVQLFDLWDRVYHYPLEITLEAMAPTSEHDFNSLPPEKQSLYAAVQRAHMHGSPDGPWFFIIARSGRSSTSSEKLKISSPSHELLGITDTSMLRPQVFALYENEAPGRPPVQIGLIASERQAINACLRSLAAEDERFLPTADRYWAARGGSHTDGGAFRFQVTPNEDGELRLLCSDKFGRPVTGAGSRQAFDRRSLNPLHASPDFRRAWTSRAEQALVSGELFEFWDWLRAEMPTLDWNELAWALGWLDHNARQGEDEWHFARQVMTLLRDRVFLLGEKKRAALLALLDERLEALFEQVERFTDKEMAAAGPQPDTGLFATRVRSALRLNWETRYHLAAPAVGAFSQSPWLLIDAKGFPPEGDEAAARWIVKAYQLGWRQMIVYGWHGGRFGGAGLGTGTGDLRLELYGDVGDYTASGLDGGEVHLHGAGQDQLGQVMKSGKLVIHGDAGQTFLYGAKGGEIYVQGSVAGRPLINAVGKPRAVINGVCLDYLAESFMAGDPHQGGGFVILNGVAYDAHGCLVELETPYPGGNLFSLASGGAIYLRDPRRLVTSEQLNGGRFADLSAADWALIEPYLAENERLFGIKVEDLLTVSGERRRPEDVYRKVTV